MSAVAPSAVRITVCGPAAIRVSGQSGSRARDWSIVHQLARQLAERGVPGLTGTIPTYESVLVEFDPLLMTAPAAAAHIRDALEGIDPDGAVVEDPQLFIVPVLYGGARGPDLDDVAEAAGVDTHEVIRLHLDPDYIVRCLGAPGGSPMLDGPAFPAPIPRLRSPRAHVPAGVVSVAGRQATIAPAASPGGWCVIGQTPLAILDPGREPLVPYRPGDRIRFERIDGAAFDRLAGRPLTAARDAA